MRRWIILGLALILALIGVEESAGQTGKPFRLPFDTPPGPTTWLLSQQYGNTVGAFNYGRYWYAGGQNLHFGLDFWAPCNTPVLAVADGEIDQVDNVSFGLEPHNLTIFHRDLGLTSVYGHLNARPTVMKGQPVKQGELVGYVGDPDRTCESRPHLHLEIRSSNYQIAYNPMPLLDSDWAQLTSIGYQNFGGFVQDLYYPRRWQDPFRQPEVDFNELALNEYLVSYPPPARDAPAPETLPTFTAGSPPPGALGTFSQLTLSGCCAHAWWSRDSQRVQYFDGPDGALAGVYAVDTVGDPAARQIANGPWRLYSPDQAWEVNMQAGRVTLIRLADGAQFPLATGGAWPRYAPDSQRILWHRHPADNIPGGIPPLTEVWIANGDGSGRSLVRTQQGGNVYWLDGDRLLIVEPVGRTNRRVLSVYTISTRQTAELLTVRDLRGLSIAPGGAILMFYAPFQEDPNASGVYGMLAQPGSTPIRLPFFGSYRWRDSVSVLFMPFSGDGRGALWLYDVTTGELRPLTDPAANPIRVLNDDWSVSPDGRRVVYWNADDLALWQIALP